MLVGTTVRCSRVMADATRRTESGWQAAALMERCNALLADELVILSVRADPEPDEPIWGLDRDCTVMQPNARRPEAADLLEME